MTHDKLYLLMVELSTMFDEFLLQNYRAGQIIKEMKASGIYVHLGSDQEIEEAPKVDQRDQPFEIMDLVSTSIQ